MTWNRARFEAILLFVTGFAARVNAGISLVRTLLALEQENPDAELREGIRQVRLGVESGMTLSGSLRKQPELFPEMLVAVVRAGEIGGILDVTLDQYARQLEQELGILNRASVDASFRGDLALWLLRLGLLLGVGVTLPDALEISAGVPVGDSLREAAILIAEAVREGETLSARLADFPELIPDGVGTLLRLGEENGNLGAMAARAARYVEVTGGAVAVSAPATPTAAGDPSIAADAARRVQLYWSSDSGRLSRIFWRDAVVSGASRILLSQQGDVLRIRYRVDGEWREAQTLSADGQRLETGTDEEDGLRIPLSSIDPQNALAFLTRMQDQAGYTPGSQRPQCGQITVRMADGILHAQVAVHPLVEGVAIGVKMGDHSPAASLEELGFTPAQREKALQLLRRPSGVLIVAAMLAADRAAVLSSLLAELRTLGVLETASVVTIDEAIPAEMPDVLQVSLSQLRVSPAEAIRSVLQQDPDVIVVSSVRDRETAVEITHAAVTGRLALVGVDAWDARAARQRLLELAPHSLAGEIVGVIACQGAEMEAGSAGRQLRFEID